MAGPGIPRMDEHNWLTLLAINAALRESYRALSLSVRVPHKLLAPGDMEPKGTLQFLSALHSAEGGYHDQGILVLPAGGGLGRVVLCDGLLGGFLGMPTRRFSSAHGKRSALARYVAAILLAGGMGFSGFSGDAERKRKTALSIMHAAGGEHYRQFSHSGFLRDPKKAILSECERVRSDQRELGINDTDLLYALEKKPTKAEETALLLRSEIAETELLLWMAEKKRRAQLSDKKAKQLALYTRFLKRTLAALARVYVARHRWDTEKSPHLPKAMPCWKALRAIAACEKIPAADLRRILEGMQTAKARIFRAVI